MKTWEMLIMTEWNRKPSTAVEIWTGHIRTTELLDFGTVQ